MNWLTAFAVPTREEVSRAIAAYLRQCPQAEDTLLGILTWWLPETVMTRYADLVSQTIASMVAEGYLEEIRRPGAPPLYRLRRQDG